MCTRILDDPFATADLMKFDPEPAGATGAGSISSGAELRTTSFSSRFSIFMRAEVSSSNSTERSKMSA
jgi:hypothetical protein